MNKMPNRWIPYKLIPEHDTIFTQWIYAGTKAYTEPFFSDTVTQLLQLKENSEQKIRTPLHELPDWAQQVTTVPTAAFIFHVSRCGSTLLTQLLGIDPENIVLSEVPFLDDILRLPVNKRFHGWNESTDSYFDAAIRLYSQQRTGNEKRVFVKTDSWHLLFYQQLRMLYPGIPFIIIYRSPREVMHSQQRQRGMHSVPGTIEPELFGFHEHDITFDLDLYMGRVLEKYQDAILKASEKDPLCYLFNYNQGMLFILKSVMELCRITPSNEMMEKAEQRSLFHSKAPGIPFEEQNTGIEISPGLLTTYLEMEQQRVGRVSYTEK